MATTSHSNFDFETMRSQVATVEQLLAAMKKQRRESHRLKSILNSISDGFFVLDRQWRVTYLNPVAASTFAGMGNDRRDLVGRPLFGRLPQLVDTPLYSNCKRTMEERSKVSFELSYPTPDRHLECHAYPWEDGISIYFKDMSARKIAERQRASELLHS